ncbi:MAG: hypothetical protein EU533_07505, partial [Promethearchaeota archaeon]
MAGNGFARDSCLEDSDFFEDRDINSCDICNSHNIQKNPEGYVCGDCGVVLSSLVMEYHRPYDESCIDHTPRGKTQIGSVKERIRNARSIHLDKLNRLDSEREGEERVKVSANYEIRRILSGLGLSLLEVKPIFKLFWKIRNCLQSGTKYRSVRKLAPITVYLHCKLNCKGINEQELLEISNITKQEFNSFKFQLRNYIPQYYSRDRKQFILQKIMNITMEFDQGMEFYHAAENVLNKLWEIIKCTKDDVVASLCTSIVALCETERELKVNSICNYIGIQMSTIHRQIEQKIFERLQVEGFKSLVRSSDMLRKVMIKLGVIEANVDKEPQPVSVIKIKLGNATQIFNVLEHIDYYIYAVETSFGSFMLIDEIPKLDYKLSNTKMIEENGVEGKLKFSIELEKYEYPKGPPAELMAL